MSDKRVPWTISDIIIALALFLVTVNGGAFIVSRILDSTSFEGVATAAFFIEYFILSALVWFFAIYRRGSNWSDLGFRSFDFSRGFGLLVALFFLVKILTFIYTVIAEEAGLMPSRDIINRLPELFGRDLTGFFFAVIVVAIVAPIVEELFFRGFIYPVFRKNWGVTSGIIVSSLLFALFHSDPFVFIPIFIIGAALAYLYEATDSLGPPILLHAVNNLISVILIYYARVF